MPANDRGGPEFTSQDSWPQLIERLYAQSDKNTINVASEPLAREPLKRPEDFALVDDVLDALMDPIQVEIARPVLRYALTEIARVALLKEVST